jgi:hypothetical protein
MARTRYIHWHDDTHFVLGQHAWLDFYSAYSLSLQPRTNMSLNFDTLFWVRADQSLLFLLNAACLAEKQQTPISKGSTDCLEFMNDDDLPLDQVFWNSANHNEMKEKQLCYFFILYVLL